MPTFSTGRLSRAIGGQLCFGSLPPLGGAYEPAGRVMVEVEDVQENDIFWALPGKQHYAEHAFIRGASGVVVCGRHVEPWAGKFSIQVDDSYAALEQLARWSRQQFTGKLISVAGPDALATAHTIQELLSNWFVGRKSEGHAIEQIESLVRLAQLPPADDFAIFPACHSNRFGSADLTGLIEPDMLVLNAEASALSSTNLESLLESLGSTTTLLINGDDQRLCQSLRKLNQPIVTVGRNLDCDFCATHISHRDGRLSFVIEGAHIVTSVSGRHQLSAVLSAYAVARTMGVAPGEIAFAASDLAALPGCSSIAATRKLTVIDDTRHASEASLRNSLELISETRTSGRRILVCGDIAVDVTSPCRVHRFLANAAVTRYRCDRLVACGTYAKDMQAAARNAGLPADEALAFENIDDLIDTSTSWMNAGDLVLVAGHRMSGMQQVAQALLKDSTSEGRSRRRDGSHGGHLHKTFEVQPLVTDLREFGATLPPG